jgi:hypothetical protein
MIKLLILKLIKLIEQKHLMLLPIMH